MTPPDIEANSVFADAVSTDGNAHDIQRMHELLTRQRKAFVANPFPSVQQRKDKLTKLIDLL